jgi:hypothetical protein
MGKNATSFKPGDPRINRKGRAKKGQSLAEKFRDALAEQAAEGTEGYSKLDQLIDKTVTMALSGEQQAIEYVFARGWGKLIDRVESNNINKNYDFSNLSTEDRMKLLELIKSARPVVPADLPDTL